MQKTEELRELQIEVIITFHIQVVMSSIVSAKNIEYSCFKTTMCKLYVIKAFFQ